MKSLKQTQLSFASIPKKCGGSSRPSQDSASIPSATPAKTQRVQKASSTQDHTSTRRVQMDCIEIPPPPKRTTRSKITAKSSSKASPAKPTAPTQPRKLSLKRKFSPSLGSDTEHRREVVHVPRIEVDPASSPVAQTGQSSRQGPLVPKDNNLAGDKTNGPSPPKKLRLSSPLSDLTPLPPSSGHGTDLDDIEFVPTSQSDELELTLPRIAEKDPVAVHDSVDKWRKETLASSPGDVPSPIAYGSHSSCSPFSELSEVPMDVDVDAELLPPPHHPPETTTAEGVSGLQCPQTPCSTTGVSLHQRIPSSSTMAASAPARAISAPSLESPQRAKLSLNQASPLDLFHPLTPPPSSDLDMEAESKQEEAAAIQALDVKSKTEKLIADIKARAYAAVHSSPEPSPLDLDALSDSDSDGSDDNDDSVVAALVSGKSAKDKREGKTPNAPAEAGPSNVMTELTPRYNLRRTSPSTKSKARSVTPPTQVRKPRKADPIAALLREKKREESTGTGMVAVRFAEETVAKSKAGLREEMEDEENGSDSESEYERDLRSNKSKGKSKSGVARPSRSQKTSRKREEYDGSEDEDAVIARIDCEAILGKKGGKAVGKILASDMKEKMAQALAKKNEKPLGVPLWAENDTNGDDSMDVEATLPPFTSEVAGHAALHVLKNAAEQNDVTQVSALLSSGFIALLLPEHYPSIVPWLIDIVFSDVNSSLSTLAYTQLKRLAPLVGARPCGLRFSDIQSVLARLGASSAILEKYGWKGDARVLRMTCDAELRCEMAYRLASLVDAFAQSFEGAELSDMLLAMVLVGMDPTTLESLQTEIRMACDSLLQAMYPAQEVAACKKIVVFGEGLSALNQSLLLSFITTTSPSTVHLARCISRSLLLGTPFSEAEYQRDLPDLSPLVELLSPATGSGGHFDITGNSDKKGYYDALTCRLYLLGKAISDVDEYTIMEMGATNTLSKKHEVEDEGEGREKEKLTVLERITRQLDILHGRIVDTRAAHLDRSRAKAALQRLSFRVHYQRVAATKSGVWGTRPRNLFGYFHKPSAP